ncbi:MAG: hypothetical protein Q7T61_02850 [Caulobacter sp.]|nr:hypothetical protein [Caulobacter sp.]
MKHSPDRGAADITTKRRAGAARGATSTNPVDIAMDAEAGGHTLDSPTLRLLGKQERLIDAEIALARDARFANRIKAVRDIALGVGAVLVVGMAGWLVWDSAHADDLVLEPWTAPPAFAAAGQGGEVLAAQLGDRIRVLQQKGELEATGVAKAAGGQSTELKLEIPSTGVSIGELQSWLRRTLGHQTVVGGSVVQLADGRLSITVRPGDGEAASFEGPPAELPALLDKAAEATLRRSDPLRYAGFLIFAERLDEAAAVVEPLTRRGKPRERANAMANMVNILSYQGRHHEALAFARRSVALDPDAPAAVGYLATAEYALGHEEEALAQARRMLTLAKGSDVSPYTAEEDAILWPTMIADQQADLRATANGYGALADLGRAWNNPVRARFWDYFESLAWLRAHDWDAARATQPPPAPAGQANPVEALMARRLVALTHLDQGRLAQARVAAAETVALQRQFGGLQATLFRYGDGPRLAEILTAAGDLAGAHELLDAGPMDCSRCVRARGTLASAERDWPRADRFFALATRQAPSIAQGWHAWGRSKAARGDLAGALAMYRRAQRAGPGWADPLKLEGDVLMRQGRASAAVKRYAIAAERAPKWGALQLAWGDALAKAGRRKEAVARWGAALGCGLMVGDRAVVEQRLASKT